MIICRLSKVGFRTAAAAILVFALLLGGGASFVSNAAGASSTPAPIVERVDGAGKKVALTFDSGWEFVDTRAILEILAQRKVKATFFLRGQWALDHPDLVAAIVAGGHAIGSHSMTHPDMAKLSTADVEKEVVGAEDALSRTAGVKVNLFRPPYGAWNQGMLRLLGERGYRAMIMWDVDSLDWKGLSTDDLTKRVLSLVKPGSIILMHVGGLNTAKALPAILDGLAAKELQPVAVSDLLTPASSVITPATEVPSVTPTVPASGGSSPTAPPAPGHTRLAGIAATVASAFGSFADRLAAVLRDAVIFAATRLASLVRSLGRLFAG